MNNMYGITGIKIAKFIIHTNSGMCDTMDTINNFINCHNGNIVDIKYDNGILLIIYTE